MINPHLWLQPLVGMADYIGNYLDGQSNNRYISLLVFSDHNGVLAQSPLLIVIFWSFSVINSQRWVLPLVRITDYIGTTLLSDHIIAIYHHCFSPIIMKWFQCNRCWLLYFEVLYDSLSWMTATNHSDGQLHYKLLFWVIKSLLYIMTVSLQLQ